MLSLFRQAHIALTLISNDAVVDDVPAYCIGSCKAPHSHSIVNRQWRCEKCRAIIAVGNPH